MVTRRQTLKIIASSLFAPALGALPISRAFGASTSSRVTDPACAACTSNEELKKLFSNILDAAPMIKHVAMPRTLQLMKRSIGAGIPIQYVESATGQLSFAVTDITFGGLPAVTFVRYYNSGSTSDIGLGRGWSVNFDDSISISGSTATLTTAAGDTIQMISKGSQSTFRPVSLGLGRGRNASQVGSNKLREKVNAMLSKVYTKFGNRYILSEFDYGQAGVISIERDADGKATGIINKGNGQRVDLIWGQGATPRLTALIDSAGRKVSFEYNGNLLASSTDVSGSTTRYSYEDGKISNIVDGAGTSLLSVRYAGLKVSQTANILGTLNYLYSGSRLTVSDTRGATSTFDHKSNGQLTNYQSSKTAQPAIFSYDENDLLQSTTSQGVLHSYKYDSQGRLQLSSKGKKWKQWQYDSDGRIETITDAAGPTTFSYDSNGAPNGASSSKKIRTYSVSYEGGRLSTFKGHKKTATFEYTPFGQVSFASENKNSKIRYEYDQMGFLRAEHLSQGYSAFGSRNERGQLIDWTDSVGRQFTFQRDIRGAVVKITNTRGDWARADRDSLGRITKLTNSQGQSRWFAYDESSNLTDYRDALGRTFSVEYDVTKSKAVRMRQTNGSMSLVRNANGDVIVESSTSSALATADSSSQISDGWLDPLNSDGLIGAFSGFSRFAAKEVATTPGNPVPGALVSMVAMGASTTGGDGGDHGDDSDDDDDDDSDTDDDDDDDDDSDAVCENCLSTYTQTCTSSYEDAGNSAQILEIAAIAGCSIAFQDDAEFVVCVGAAEAAYQAAGGTAQTNYQNCVSVISQECYSQCN